MGYARAWGGGGGVIVTHSDAADFLLSVLVGLTGSRLRSNVPAVPSWVQATRTGGQEPETGLRGYAEVRKLAYCIVCRQVRLLSTPPGLWNLCQGSPLAQGQDLHETYGKNCHHVRTAQPHY